jgi:hypothetical protein
LTTVHIIIKKYQQSPSLDEKNSLNNRSNFTSFAFDFGKTNKTQTGILSIIID